MADYAIHEETLTGISNVIRKKDGTVALIDPADYADRINLMGMLEEKTVSGTIAHITDGADEVPLKKCEITLPASLDGYSEVDVVSAGKNLVDGTDFTQGLPSTTIGASIDTISASTRYAYFGTAIKGENYNVSSVSIDADYYNAILIFGYSNGILSVYTGGTVNGNKTIDLSACDYVRVAIGTRNNTFVVPTDFTDYGTIQLEVGSTASEYEAYTAPTVSTVNLGRTIYGGSADVVSGQGESTHAKISDFSTLRANGTSSTGAYRYIIDVSGMGDYNVGACVSNLLTYRVSYNANVGEFYNTSNVLIIFLAQDSASDAIAYLQSNSCEIAYPLATPETFTFTPITPTPETALGVNNFWADEGDSEVTYRSQGTVTVYPNAEEASF